ncbi:hypothetical protein N9W18_01195 [Planktomarina sp.]|nr:hypothetical protein [Planktomarina sp.]
MKDFHFLIIGRGLQAILSIASLRLITTYLDKSEIAKFYLIGSIIFFFSSVLLGGFSTYFNRNLLEDRARSHELFLKYMIQAIMLGILSIGFNALFITLIIGHINNVHLTIVAIFLHVTVSSILRNLLASVNIFQDVKFFVLFNSISLLLGILIASLFIQHISPRAAYWFLGISVGEVIILPFVYLKFRKLCSQGDLITSSTNRPLLTKSLMSFVGPLMLVNLFVWFQMHAYRLLTQTEITVETLSDLTVGLGVALAIFAVAESLVNQHFYPKYLRKIQSGNQKDRVIDWQTFFNTILIVYVSVALFTIACSKSLVVLLTDPKFHNIYLITSLAALIELSRVVNNVFMWLHQSENNTKYTILPYFISVLVLIFCLKLFEIKITFYYIILALLLSHFIVSIYFIVNLKILYRIKFSKMILENVKYYICLVLTFCMIYLFSNLNDFISFHFIVVVIGLAAMVVIYYPLMRKK